MNAPRRTCPSSSGKPSIIRVIRSSSAINRTTMREIEGTLPYERVPVHKSFASHALHRKRGALHVVNAELGASVLTEIKFSDQGASYHVRRHVSKVPTGDSC